MDCDICFHQYDVDERQPRTLPCGHTLCDICITQGIKENKLTCPFCREDHSITDPSDIPVTFTILKAIRTFTSNGHNSKEELPNSIGSSTRRDIVPELHAGICAEHGSYRLFWCCSCKIWICRDCTVVEHPSTACKVTSIKQALDMIKDEESDHVKRMVEMKTEHENLLSKCKLTLLSCEVKIDVHLEAYQQVIAKLRQQKAELSKEMEIIDVFFSKAKDSMEKLTNADKTLHENLSVQDITASRHICVRYRREVEEMIDTSNNHLGKVDVAVESKKLLQKMEVMLKVDKENDNALVSAVGSFIKKYLHVKSSLDVSEMINIGKYVDLYAKTEENNEVVAITIQCGDIIHVHAEPEDRDPLDTIQIPYKNLVHLPSVGETPEVFLELCWEAKVQGCVHIKLDKFEAGSPNEDFYKRFLTGSFHQGNSFVNTKMIQVEKNNTEFYKLCGGIHAAETGKEVTYMTGNVTSYSLGRVILATYGDIRCFSICYKNCRRGFSNSTKSVMVGNVTHGLDIVEKAAEIPNVADVEVTACGIILKK